MCAASSVSAPLALTTSDSVPRGSANGRQVGHAGAEALAVARITRLPSELTLRLPVRDTTHPRHQRCANFAADDPGDERGHTARRLCADRLCEAGTQSATASGTSVGDVVDARHVGLDRSEGRPALRRRRARMRSHRACSARERIVEFTGAMSSNLMASRSKRRASSQARAGQSARPAGPARSVGAALAAALARLGRRGGRLARTGARRVRLARVGPRRLRRSVRRAAPLRGAAPLGRRGPLGPI